MPVARIIEDPDYMLTAQDIVGLPRHRQPRHDTMISIGLSSAAYWFDMTLDNSGALPLRRLLVFEPTWLDQVQVSLIEPDDVVRRFEGGDFLPFDHRATAHRMINFELNVPPGRSHLVVRTQTSDPYIVGMTLWESEAFLRYDSSQSVSIGFVYGVIGAMLLYNLFLYFAVRAKVYLAYVAYLFFFLVAHATYNGHTYALVWPDHPVIGNWAHSVFIYLFLANGVVFAIQFLELRERLPAVYTWARGLLAAILASFVFIPLTGSYGLHVSSSIAWVLIYAPGVLLLGLLSLATGNRAARFFLTAAVAGFVGSFITALAVLGLIPFT